MPQQVSLQVLKSINVSVSSGIFGVLSCLMQPKAHEEHAYRGALRAFPEELRGSSSRRAAPSRQDVHTVYASLMSSRGPLFGFALNVAGSTASAQEAEMHWLSKGANDRSLPELSCAAPACSCNSSGYGYIVFQ